MRKPSHVAKHWHSAAAALCAVIIGALSVGSAGQALPVQAADNPADVYFEVWAFPEAPPPVCINKTLIIYASVNKGVTKIINGTPYQLPRGLVLGGVSIHSSQTNSSVGTLKPVDLPVTVDSGGATPGQVKFVFTATRRGTTNLIFESNGIVSAGGGAADAELTSLGKKIPAKRAEIPVNVIPCNFKVTTITRFTGAVYNTVAVSNAKVAADDQGSATGSAPVTYATAITDASCTFKASDSPSQVDWTGTVDVDQLVLTGSFQPSMTTFSALCPPAPVFSSQQPWSMDPLTIRLALSDSSSITTMPQVAGTVTGSADIIVIPEECTATC